MQCQAIIEDTERGKSYSQQRIRVPGHRPCTRGASIQIGPLCLCAVHARLAQEGLIDSGGVVAAKQDIATVHKYPERYPHGLHEWAKGVKPIPVQEGRRKPPLSLYALFDQERALAGVYESREEADTDAVGPRFRQHYEVRQYRRVPRILDKP